MANHFGDFDFIVFVPFRAPRLLSDQMPRMIAPGRQGLLVLPPDHRNPFAVVRSEGLEIDEAGHVLGRGEHFRSHLAIIVARDGGEAGSE